MCAGDTSKNEHPAWRLGKEAGCGSSQPVGKTHLPERNYGTAAGMYDTDSAPDTAATDASADAATATAAATVPPPAPRHPNVGQKR